VLVCDVVAGDHGDSVVVTENELALALVSRRVWATGPGHVLVVPNAHIENLYDLDDAPALDVHGLTRPFLDYSSGWLESRLTISTRPGIPVIAS
jgi:diadenosine tetraphosphate (Ap4A) HIT family hydrolase